MVLARVLRRETRRKECPYGNGLYETEFVRQTTSPPLCLCFRNTTDSTSLSEILRQDGRSERLLPDSPGRGIINEDNIPPWASSILEMFFYQ